MNVKYLFTLLFLFLFCYYVKAQQMKPADPVLRPRLEKYATDNHLPAGNMYMYWDTVAKKAVRFQAGSFLVEDAQLPAVQQATKPPKGNPQSATGNFHLVKDLEQAANSYPAIYLPNVFSPLQPYAVLNNIAYFTAYDGMHSSALWRSDGTAAGTYAFKGNASGIIGYSPVNLFANAGHLFFISFYGNTSNYNVFVTDGTDANLTTLFPAASTFNVSPNSFVAAGNDVYFTTGFYRDYKIWKTDGTPQGTTLIKDYSGVDIEEIRNLTYAGGLVYFTAYSSATGNELYRCDGTSGGTYLVKDLNTRTDRYTYMPELLTPYNSKLYFAGNDGSGYKLWMSDGTGAGTVPVTDNSGDSSIFNTSFIGLAAQMLVKDNVLYFSGYSPASGWELYKHDAAGTGGVTLVQDILPGTAGYAIAPYQMAALSSGIFFFYNDGNVYHLYKTDGSATGAVSIKDFGADAGIYSLYTVNGKLYFAAGSNYTDVEPWVSDGTAAGTSKMADIYPGTVGSQPSYFTPLNGSVLFQATDSAHGNELFIASGNTVQLVQDINTTATSSSATNNVMTPFKDGIITTAYTYRQGVEPYTATSNSEDLIKDIYPVQPSSSPGMFVVKGSQAYFTAADGHNTRGIFKTDGTPANTANITGNINGLNTDLAVTDNGNIFYVVGNGAQPGNQLWKTDGTPQGTVLLGSYLYISTNGNNNKYSLFTTIGNMVYYIASTQETGSELYKSDGTVAGTGLVKDITPGTAGSSLNSFTAYKNKLCFSAYDGTASALWQTDGTGANTVQLATVQAGNLCASGSYLYFSGRTSTTGTELWRSDGTAAGTALLKDIIPGSQGSSPFYLTDVNGTLYFQCFDANFLPQLYKSDGTSAGTVQLTSFGSYNVMLNLTAANNNLFFLLGNKLWFSNGTPEGTQAVDDEAINDLSVMVLAANGNTIFLQGYNYRYGGELYAGFADAAVLPVTLTAFTASLKGSDVVAQWQTSSEINTSYFNIQRSTDGVHFTTVGRMDAKGSGSTYLYPDINVANLVSVKTVYYRLQVIDKDGSTSFSKTIPVDLNLKDAVVLLLPNPVKDVLRIRVNNYTGKASISVFDANGKAVYSAQKTMQSGSDVTINTSLLQSGVYMVKISLNGKMVQQKFIKE